METLIRKGRKQAEGTHKTKSLSIYNNRRATAADKKVAVLPTSGSLIKETTALHQPGLWVLLGPTVNNLHEESALS